MTAMDEIRHVVVLMLENQSFDHLLGYLELSLPSGETANIPPAIVVISETA